MDISAPIISPAAFETCKTAFRWKREKKEKNFKYDFFDLFNNH
jgi:hypothetical protein